MSASGPRLLVVDDDPAVRRYLEALLGGAGFQLASAGTGAEFFEKLGAFAPDLCILDMSLPDTTGLKILERVRETHPELPAIMLTGDDRATHATAAMKLRAFDYILKPPDKDELLLSIRNALAAYEREGEVRRLRAEVRHSYSFDMIVGNGAAMRAAKAEARRYAASEASALVRGESGTGKELFARAMHFGGPRAPGPFIDVNCAALTESLLESEIFGHEKGAFTGALGRHIGKFEQAHGGTIFLDEIGDMPLATQAKLLRVLQERTFQRVGGTERVSVDVRVVSATNQPLEEAVAKGRFRQDLFYRINTVMLSIPPLRERTEDIGELARHFVALAAKAEGKRAPEIGGEARQALEAYAWPGNVRELENAMRRAVVLCDAGAIAPGHLPSQILKQAESGGGPSSGGLTEAVESLERRMIREALEKNGWVKARAARALGVTERILAYKVDNYGIREPEGRTPKV